MARTPGISIVTPRTTKRSPNVRGGTRRTRAGGSCSRIMPRLVRSGRTATLAALLLWSPTALERIAVAQPPDASRPRGRSNQQAGRVAPCMPLRLVKRSQQAAPPENDSRYGRPIELPAREDAQPSDNEQSPREQAAGGGSVTFVVLSSLAIVLGLFFLVVWLARRALPRSATSLPTDVLEVLGRSPLAARHNLQLIRLGRRLLLVSVTPDAAETLAEVTDVDEVNNLTSLCRQNQPGSATSGFRDALHQLGSERQSRSRQSDSFPDRSEFERGPATTQGASLRRSQ